MHELSSWQWELTYVKQFWHKLVPWKEHQRVQLWSLWSMIGQDPSGSRILSSCDALACSKLGWEKKNFNEQKIYLSIISLYFKCNTMNLNIYKLLSHNIHTYTTLIRIQSIKRILHISNILKTLVIIYPHQKIKLTGKYFPQGRQGRKEVEMLVQK